MKNNLLSKRPIATFQDTLRLKPFHLSPENVEWVYRTFEALPLRSKLAQLFNTLLVRTSPDELRKLARTQPGAVTHMLSSELEALRESRRVLTECSDIPMLFSADLEGGAINLGCITPFTNQLGMAAAASESLYERAIGLVAQEAAALGINWSFTPVVDINADFRSAIVATRSFGSNPGTVAALSSVNVRTMQSRGIAATAKHWPGEGHDARDQHLVTTINPLTMNHWRATFGLLYQSLIDDGVLSVMSAHIALPAYAQERGVQGLEAYRPASVSRLLNIELLRGELGFNGLVVSDASSMGGLTSWGPRSQVLPELIENGCDMVLFTPDIESDLAILELAIAQERLSAARVDEAVLRILAMKAALRLHKSNSTETFPPVFSPPGPVDSDERTAILEAVAAASPTLVKDTRAVIPISLDKHKRVMIVSDPHRSGFDGLNPNPLIIDRLLDQEGFTVNAYDASKPPVAREVDLLIYLLAQESLLTKSHIYLDWVHMLGRMEAAMRRHWYEIPSVLISFGQPYYLYDAPRMPCVINAYSSIDAVQHAVVRKLLGKESFTGVSPVDAFCGLPDARF